MTFFADAYGEFTKSMCMDLVHPVVDQLGFLGRSKRYAAYAVDGKIKFNNVSYSEEDPVGKDDTSSYVDEVIASIKKL